MSYYRVCPRDLFNEANLLKCLGKLTLLIHDGDMRLGNRLNFAHEDERAGFKIDVNDDDGSIYCSNILVFDNNGTPIYLSRGLNSRLSWPLEFNYNCGFGDKQGFVFDENGNFSTEFLDAIKQRG